MKIKKAFEFMTKDVVTVKPETPLVEVMNTLLDKHITGLPVVDDAGMLIGIVSEIDLVNPMSSGNADDTVAGEIMSTNLTTFAPEATCAEIANCLAANRIRRVPIVDGGKVVGIVSRRDILREMLSTYYDN